jgi:DNA-binding transcriptional regulator YiaG
MAARMTPARIKEARQMLGLTASQLAAVMGARTATIYEWEAGRRNISAMPARLLRAYLDGYRPPDWPQQQG